VNAGILSLGARRRLAAAGAVLLVGWVAALVMLAPVPERHPAARASGRPTVVVDRWDVATVPAPARVPARSTPLRASVANDSADPAAAGPLAVPAPRILALSRAWLDAMQDRETRRPADRATPEGLRAYGTRGGYSVDFDLRRGGYRQLGQLTVRTGDGAPRVARLQLGALVRARTASLHRALNRVRGQWLGARSTSCSSAAAWRPRRRLARCARKARTVRCCWSGARSTRRITGPRRRRAT
jgi:hypothetical protein